MIRPSVLYNPSQKRILSKRSENLRTLRFLVDGKHLENAYGTFRKRRAQDNDVISMHVRVKSKMTGDCCVFNFSPRSVNIKYIFDGFSE